MRLKSIIHATLALAAAGALCGPVVAQELPSAARPPPPRSSSVGDIRIEGLQRISEGTVYNYLPINIGDRLDQRRVAEALRALYDTKFFRDVEMRRDGGTLVIAVLERPSIESFEIKGNKDIKTEDLQKSLRNVGLATGKTFDQSVLDEVKQYLTDQYFSRGKYAVRVDAKVEEVPGNKVKLTIDVNEGKRARIRQINVAGNTAFTDEELLEQFELKTPNWLSWYKLGRPLRARSAVGRPREAALVLHGPRLREFRRDLDAGGEFRRASASSRRATRARARPNGRA